MALLCAVTRDLSSDREEERKSRWSWCSLCQFVKISSDGHSSVLDRNSLVCQWWTRRRRWSWQVNCDESLGSGKRNVFDGSCGFCFSFKSFSSDSWVCVSFVLFCFLVLSFRVLSSIVLSCLVFSSVTVLIYHVFYYYCLWYSCFYHLPW